MADAAAVETVETTQPTDTPAAPQEAAPSLREVVKEAAAPAKPEPKRYRVKVDGEEMEVDEEELTRGYQRGAAARKRFEEAAKRAEQVEARLKAIKDNPWALLEEAGLSPDELAQQRVLAAIERERQQAERAQLPEPVRRQLDDADKARTELERLKAEQGKAQQAKADAQRDHYVKAFNQALPQAMEAAGLPRTTEAAAMVVQTMQAMIRAKMPADPVQASKMVADELLERNFSVMRGLSPERIAKALGKDALAALQRHLIAQAKGAPKVNGKVETEPKPAPKGKTWLSPKEWDEKYG